jgi:hypothetical protein
MAYTAERMGTDRCGWLADRGVLQPSCRPSVSRWRRPLPCIVQCLLRSLRIDIDSAAAAAASRHPFVRTVRAGSGWACAARGRLLRDVISPQPLCCYRGSGGFAFSTESVFWFLPHGHIYLKIRAESSYSSVTWIDVLLGAVYNMAVWKRLCHRLGVVSVNKHKNLDDIASCNVIIGVSLMPCPVPNIMWNSSMYFTD